ncbi:MAG: HlyD family efflux transporter periplasmic adaptor subunit [Thauera sp.]|nr:HlyD family efflux transporter periplasmic adaptor subunit [Thauera sp.]
MTQREAKQELRAPCPPAWTLGDGARLLLRLQAAMFEHRDFAAAATACVTELAIVLGAHRVTLGMLEDGFARVIAVSHGGDGKFGGELFLDIAAAMDECIEQRRVLLFPEPEDAFPSILMAHRRLSGHLSGSVCSEPIRYGEEVIGVACIEWSPDAVPERQMLDTLADVLAVLGPVLAMMRRQSMPWHRSLLARLRGLRQSLGSADGSRTRIVLVALAALLLVAALFPAEYRVGGRARVEGVVERALVAPNDGFLQRARVRPGDRVLAGQVLVELADQELKVEQSRWRSELAQYENAYMAALARSDRGEMMVQLAKAQEADAKVKLTEHALGRVRVEAPFDGVVIAGDLTRSLGAPVKRGEILMTLAPAEQYRVVAQISERDVGQVEAGQRGALALSALPWDALPVRVERVAPMASVVDGENVFDVELSLEKSAHGLRPGLQGVAKLRVGSKSLVARWGGPLLDWIRFQWWRWGG